ncbi:HypC/HybG/HupF family hydrogenase formation chaperone [uncultured Desulfovibrio sp.]|uniref:HypC/HybG/HupF family hydrogenase formation chaperone n=1 Tax=uncultured Desulfovibrio sp. TaxID=167968 RepID=UPI0026030856|nr:HypC/HybG/HupF family hydrogenase formation chaperone [uncultured Desulfovibrio sp.]
MCLAIPAQIVELQEAGMARVRVGESQTFLTASMMLLPEEPKVGDYVIVHAGFALHALTPEEARENLAALRELVEADEGRPAPF